MIKSVLKKHLPTIGIIALFIGFLILYLAVYGNNLFYTQTYYHISKILPPAIDVWMFIVGLAVLVNLLFLTLMPNAKFRTIEILGGNRRLRKVVGPVGLFLTIGAAFFFVVGKVFQVPWMLNVLSTLTGFIPIALFGAIGLIALVYAISPKATIGRRLATLKARLIALFMAIILSVFVIGTVELMMKKHSVKQVAITPTPQSSNTPSHSVSVILEEYPKKIRPGESITIELLFRLTNYDPNETANRYPISLDPNHKYATSATLRTVGFEIAEPPKELQSPRVIEVNQPLGWNWIISPKGGKEGTSQSVAFDVFIHDLTDNKVVFQSPITTLTLEVGTPLGLPTWLISPQLGVGAIIGGGVSLLLPWILGGFSNMRKERRAKDKPSISIED